MPFGVATYQVSSSLTLFNFKHTHVYVKFIINDDTGDSRRLITGSADQTAKLWDVQTGQQLFTFNFDSPARSVDFAVGDKLAVITTDPFMELPSAIHVKRIARDPTERNLFHLNSFRLLLLLILMLMLMVWFLRDRGICASH